MAVKKFNPITPGLRTKIGNAFSELTTDKPEKSLLSPLKKTGGRNSVGRMTMRQKGGGHKRRYRIIDFRRDKDGIPAVVKTIEYDPNRSAFIVCWSTQMAKSGISLLLIKFRWAQPYFPERMHCRISVMLCF